MEIVLMGTACAETGIDRENTYLLLYEDSGSTLVDIGGSPLGKLKKLNVPLSNIRRIVFTHFHTDHIYGFPSLLWGMWIAGRREPLDIYCSETEKAWLEEWIQIIGTKKWPIRFEICIHTFNWKIPTELWLEQYSSLSVFPGIHGVPSIGVRYEQGGKVMVYSSDSKVNPHIQAMDKIDLLIHECTKAEAITSTHSSLKQLAEFYDWNKVDRAVMVHLTDGEDYEVVMSSLPDRIRNKISFGEDLIRLQP